MNHRILEIVLLSRPLWTSTVRMTPFSTFEALVLLAITFHLLGSEMVATFVKPFVLLLISLRLVIRVLLVSLIVTYLLVAFYSHFFVALRALGKILDATKV